jgi:hypothetical protein
MEFVLPVRMPAPHVQIPQLAQVALPAINYVTVSVCPSAARTELI